MATSSESSRQEKRAAVECEAWVKGGAHVNKGSRKVLGESVNAGVV
jgi:hypothetical protein